MCHGCFKDRLPESLTVRQASRGETVKPSGFVRLAGGD